MRIILELRTGGRRFVRSQHEKLLMRLGDGASIAILKLADNRALASPQFVSEILPIIRDSFGSPHAVSEASNRKPKITELLLNRLLYEVSDGEVKTEIQETLDFVMKQAGEKDSVKP